MARSFVEALERHGFKVSLHVEPETVDPEGNTSAWGTDEDARYLAEIRERLENGDVWAWAWVRVTVAGHGFEGTDSLGGCCYRDEADFRATTLDDMARVALDDLKDRAIRATREGPACLRAVKRATKGDA